MKEYILEAKTYFTEEAWRVFDESEQKKYGQVLYIYFACLHLDINVQVPAFMLKTDITKEIIRGNQPIYKCRYCKTTFLRQVDRNKHRKMCSRIFFVDKTTTCSECDLKCKSWAQLQIHKVKHTKEKSFQCELCGKSYGRKGDLKSHIDKIHLTVESEFQCDKCSYRTKYKSALRRHLRAHSQREKNTCEICSEKFASESRLKLHKFKYHKTENPLKKCTECDYTASSQWDLKKHYYSHFMKAAPLEKCGKCDFTTSNQMDLKRHLLSHFKGTHKCYICQEVFKHKCQVSVHINTVHLKIKKYKCSQCEFATAYKTTLLKHSHSHSNTKPFHCELCLKGFGYNSDLNRHMEAVHLKIKPFKCSDCGFTSTKKTKLLEHRQMHSSASQTEKLYKCSACGKAFLRNFNLKRHVFLVHLKNCDATTDNISSVPQELPFKCDECDYATDKDSKLKKHEATHLFGGKKLKCSQCDYTADYPSAIKSHSYVHSNEKPFTCSICGKGFSHKSDMKKHKLIHFKKQASLV